MTIKIYNDTHFKKTISFLNNAPKKISKTILKKYADETLTQLQRLTPIDSGDTRSQWSYSIVEHTHGIRVDFKNSNINQGIPIAILIQYGHATKSGSYIPGVDYINPAVRPVFEKFRNDIMEVIHSG